MRRAREVELVAQSWSEDKVAHVYRDGEEVNVTVSQDMWKHVKEAVALETLSI